MSDFDPDRLDARSPATIAALLPWARRLSRGYFRAQVAGIEQVPRGPLILAGNHNNGLAGPEILSTLVALWKHQGPETPLYALAHDFAMRHFTPFGDLIQRFGGVRASPENARRILDAGGQILVYPGGDLEAYRHSRRRNEIVLGRRRGFLRVAQEKGVPLVPVVAHGAHRSAYIFSEGESIARAMGLKRWARLERFPLALSFPWGLTFGPWLPYFPLPFPIRLRFLPPRRVAPDEDLDEARERLRRDMQAALDEMACEARSEPR